MKALSKFLKYKKLEKRKEIDSETIFYIFNKIIEVQYGEVGKANVKPSFYKDGNIFLEINNSNWANEVWLNKKMLIDEINKKIGGDDIKEIKVKY
jgi:Dna[CI] antecedent, DciA